MKLFYRSLSSIALFSLACLSVFGQGSTLGVNVVSAGSVQNNGPFYIGYEINVATPITVSGLGILDFSAVNQLSAAVNVGIYSCSPGGTSPKVGTYITSLQLQSGLGQAQGPVDYFIQGLPTPVVLTPGNYLILAEAGSGKPQGYSTNATVFFSNNVTYVNGWFGGSAFPGSGTNVTVTNQSGGSGSYMSPVYLVQSLPTATTTLTSSSNPSSIGQNVTFTASVSPSSATGTVNFYDNQGQIGTAQTLSNGTASITTAFPAATTQYVYGVYSGNSNYTGSQSNEIMQVVSSAPQISPITITGSLSPGQVGQPYNASFSATGGAGSYSWNAAGLPPGLSMSGSGAVTGTPTTAGSYFVNVSVSGSGGGSASQSATVVISASPVTISGNANLGDIPIGGSVAGSFSASGGTPPYRWSLSGISGLSVDSNGNLRGSVSQPGNLTATLSVADSASGSATLSLNLSVLGISGSLPAGSTTAPYSGNVAAVGGVGPYTYAASGVPQGLTFNAGALSGTPTSAGSYSIGVRVTDSKGISASGTFPLSITGPAPTSLTVTSNSLPDAYAGQSYSQSLNAGGGSAPYTWSLSGGRLPAGLSLTSSGIVVGTPSSPLSTSFGVKVTDSSNNQAVGTISLNVDPAPLQITTGSTFPNGVAGVNYPSQILTATGGVAPYTFSIKGSLPAGLALSNGSIGGTPTAAGSFSFTLIVTDSGSPASTVSLGITGAIVPASPNIVISGSSAAFNAIQGTTNGPAGVNFTVNSSGTTQSLTYSTFSSVNWLTVGGSSATPGNIAIQVNNLGLALSAAGSPYSGTVTVTCTSSACSGATQQQIAVTLNVTAPPPQLSVDTGIVQFVSLFSNPQTSTSTLNISNVGGGTLNIISVTSAAPWLTVGGAPLSLGPGISASLTLTANPTGVAGGFYSSSITVNSSAGSATVPVTLVVSGAPSMTLGPSGYQFLANQGGAVGNPAGSFLVSVSNGSSNYSATVLPGPSWLTGGGTGTASAGAPGSVPFTVSESAVAALPVGFYFGTIRVTGSAVVNSPQDFQVILEVGPSTSPVVPDPEPAGLVFITSSGAAAPQTVTVYSDSINSNAFLAATDGSSWLSISPSGGSTAATSPGQFQVTASAAGLQPGVYRGAVNVSLYGTGAGVRGVNVTLIVPSSGHSTASGVRPEATAATCTSGQLVPTETGLAGSFTAPAAWPTPLSVLLYDSCGNVIGNGQVITTFSNGDPPLPLTAVDPVHGLYSGTWTPRSASPSVTISARASQSNYPTVTTKIAGQVAPNAAPILAANGTGDVFNPQVGAGLGPGNIVQIYGSNLANQPATPQVLPLPTTVGGTQVIVGGIQAPLYYVSPGQINAQIPFELTGGNQYQLIVSANGALTTPQTIQITPAVPAVLQFTSGDVEAEHADGSLITSTSPATPGENVVVFMSGLGATNPAVPDGVASPSNPPAVLVAPPGLTLNGASVPVQFAGLTPTLVGLYQINFQVPSNLATGNYNLSISVGGTPSNQTVLAVQSH